MIFRPYDENKDKNHAPRIFREVGWVEEGKEEHLIDFLKAGPTFVAELRGEAECLVATAPGTVRYLEEDVPFSAVTSVVTSRVARRQGLATRLTAHALAAAVAEGAILAGLGIFDQGFYNRLGFGTGSYVPWIAFDPRLLKLDNKPRPPRRLGKEDCERMHASRIARLRCHGATTLLPVEITRAEIAWTTNGFGLGYEDGPDGELSHHFWAYARGEHGPYGIVWMSYQTPAQLLELLALLKNLSDQVHLVRMVEPPLIQLQDLLRQPFRARRVTRDGKLENQMWSAAYWQTRICDLPACLARTHLCGEDVRFNLSLHDPVARYLPDDAPWRGIGGDYVVCLGETSHARPGTDPALPTLSASAGAFSRMWLGVRPASSVAITDDLSASPELLAALDRVLRIPVPYPDWDY